MMTLLDAFAIGGIALILGIPTMGVWYIIDKWRGLY